MVVRMYLHEKSLLEKLLAIYIPGVLAALYLLPAHVYVLLNLLQQRGIYIRIVPYMYSAFRHDDAPCMFFSPVIKMDFHCTVM